MKTILGWGGRMRGLFADSKGPWGTNNDGAGSGGSEPSSDDGGSPGPWGDAPRNDARPTGKFHPRPALGGQRQGGNRPR